MAQSTKHPSSEHHHNAAAAHKAPPPQPYQAAHHHSQGKQDEAKAHATSANEHSEAGHKHTSTQARPTGTRTINTSRTAGREMSPSCPAPAVAALFQNRADGIALGAT